MALAGEPGHEHEHERWDRLREAAIEAEFETGRHEDTVEEARSISPVLNLWIVSEMRWRMSSALSSCGATEPGGIIFRW